MKYKILCWTRRILALSVLIVLCLLFAVPEGYLRYVFGWMAKVQFFPALSAMAWITVAVIFISTFVCGRAYCSLICPLGITQDVIARINRLLFKKKYKGSEEKRTLRYGVLALFVLAWIFLSYPIVRLLEPYSIFGRAAYSVLSPLGRWINTILADSSAANGDLLYAQPALLHYVGSMAAIGIVTLLIISILAWRGGRTWCNTVCPVGTFLSFPASVSLYKIGIDKDKCLSCGLCEKGCKTSAINVKEKTVDTSRCVDCLNCTVVCKKGAIAFIRRKDIMSDFKSRMSLSYNKYKSENKDEQVSNERRTFLKMSSLTLAGASADAMAKIADGGLAKIEDKIEPKRETPVTPAGSYGFTHINEVCTACGLCITACPNEVLRPNRDLSSMMTPVMSFETGYCRPECTRCADVCPTGAIRPITREEKTAIHIGHAVLVKENCLSMKEGINCGNCARHCPAGAIVMTTTDPNDELSPKMPVIDSQKCIGCGACEYLCPSRPYSAIYVEGHIIHREE